MTQVLRRILARKGDPPAVLIGYSGGAVLARLIAERVPETRVLITVAGNFDVARWCRLHGYSPLVGSLDPSKRPALSATVRQLHLHGAQDPNCPPYLAAHYLEKEPRALSQIYADYDHKCCWVEQWPSILARALEAVRTFAPAK